MSEYSATFSPVATGDDSYISTVSGLFVNNSYLTIGGGGSGSGFGNTYIRFPNFTIPESAEILTAKITLTSPYDEARGTCNARIHYDNAINSVAPTNHAEFDALVLSTSYAEWPNVPASVTDQAYDTPSLANIIQEIVDDPDYASGNAIGIVMVTQAGSSETSMRYGKGVGWDGTGLPVLTITYTRNVRAVPFILTSSLSAYNVDTPDSLGYAYEENTTGVEMDVDVKTGEGVGKNILQQKQMKYLYYDINTHGKDVTVTVYIDGVAQTNTITLNTTSRTRARYEDIPDTWQGYRFSLAISCDDLTDDDLEIYSPFAIQYVPFGV
jgi:hypothetical protein